MRAIFLRNRSAFSTERLREMMTFAAGRWALGEIDVTIGVRRGHVISGRAFPCGRGKTRRRHIHVSIGREIGAARLWTRHLGERIGVTGEDQVFYVLAHEIRHIMQGRYGRKMLGYPYMARGRYSEVDAEAYGVRMLRAWRLAQPTRPAGSFASYAAAERRVRVQAAPIAVT